MSDDQQHIRNLIHEKWRRLRVLELQKARLGLATPPHIILEIEDLRREIAELEATRAPTAGLPSGAAPPAAIDGPLGDRVFADRQINAVVGALRKKHRELNTEHLPLEVLIPLLDILFDRKTFRFEPMKDCTEQRWIARLHAAYQVLEILEAYQINVRERGTPEQARLYTQLLRAVNRYAMQMGVHLFEPGVGYSDVRLYVGRPEFESLPLKSIEFPRYPDKRPQLPAATERACDEPRRRAVNLMGKLYTTVKATP
jgi:hypothetical protein